MEACSTCATILTPEDGKQLSEKPPPDQRRVPCCDRIICGECIVVRITDAPSILGTLYTNNTDPQNNARFATYCPYCQISSEPNPLPQGLKAPPAYHIDARRQRQPPPPPPPCDPPPYSARNSAENEKAGGADDTLHFLNHEHDSILSLSLRYGVPQDALRRANKIHSDHLLLARKTVLIPGAFYKAGVSLSPRPVEGEAEELRKSKIRRIMTACKLVDYGVAQLYLEQAGYNLERAVDTYFEDEAWEQTQRDRNRNQASTTRWFFRGLR
ncbi:Peptidoglycan-binding lysin domain protein [Beauveria brongniartii RCEF 3172]|uniref:Peptidoglycan-binding lysin domain protein n=1 Tax=Beauveria brongniartii RCEF 3172 TaxID=1081107 RepID=A0A167HTQ0_9HYPO|nr:Peptidoglycan-binding lysin domain protein [Beauveria brongniartii RCEF 3172]